MPEPAFRKPVGDTVPKIDEEVAVGEDLEFQRRWWRFENAVWIFFALLIVLDLAGVFGRGPAAAAHLDNAAMHVDYERVERAGTPSMMRIHFTPQALHDGKVRLFISESMVHQLGNARVIPAPESSTVGGGGITYSFPATSSPATVTFALEPQGASVTPFSLRTPDTADGPLSARILVLP